MEELSIFIDESGDFGKFCADSPFYIVTLVLHEQKHSISEQVQKLNDSLAELQLNRHTIHTGPLIRREKSYKHNTFKERYALFCRLYNFTRSVPIKYKSIVIDKKFYSGELKMTEVISKQLSLLVKDNFEYFNRFENIIVYYDNGQMQLTKIILSVFSSLFDNYFEFRGASPDEYKLFQSADFLCTLSLLEEKIKNKIELTSSEKKFFGSSSKIKKNYLKYIEKIKFL